MTGADGAGRSGPCTGWADEVLVRTMIALEAEADLVDTAGRPDGPVLGIPPARRRHLLGRTWSGLPDPSPDELADAVRRLRRLAGREYAQAADDLLDRWVPTGARTGTLHRGES